MGAGLPKYVNVNLNDISSLGLPEDAEVSLEALIDLGVLNPSGRDRRLPLKVSSPPPPLPCTHELHVITHG